MKTYLNPANCAQKLALLVGLEMLLAGFAIQALAQGPPNPSQSGRPRQFGPQQPNRPPQFGGPRQFGSQQQLGGQQQFNAQQQFGPQRSYRAPSGAMNPSHQNGFGSTNQSMQGRNSLPHAFDGSQRGPMGQFNRPQGRGSNSGDPRNGGPTYGPIFDNPRGGNSGGNRYADSQNAAPQHLNPGPAQNELTVELTDENFQAEVLKSKLPVLVDIWAPWCGPCMAIAPMIDEVAQENAGSFKVGKLNLDECPEVAKAFNIQGLPTLLIFQNGELIDSILGAPEKEKLQAALDAVEQ